MPTGCWEAHVDEASGWNSLISQWIFTRETSDGSLGGVCREEERKASENCPVGKKRKGRRDPVWPVTSSEVSTARRFVV